MEKTIFIYGCDDLTRIDMDLTDEEIIFVEKLAKLSKENSSSHCQPTIEIKDYEEEEKRQDFGEYFH